MPDLTQAVRLTRRYQQRLVAIGDQAETRMGSLWDDLGSWDEADVERFILQAGPVTLGVQRAASALTVGYLGLMVGKQVPTLADFAAPDLRGAFLAYWGSLGRGEQWDRAITTGRTRAGTIGLDAAHTSARDTATVADDSESSIVGWERVPGGVTCEFCATVSTQRYHSAESASFGHERCDCSVVPIVGKNAPGRVINRERLDALKSIPADDRTGYVTADGDPAPRPDRAPAEAP